MIKDINMKYTFYTLVAAFSIAGSSCAMNTAVKENNKPCYVVKITNKADEEVQIIALPDVTTTAEERPSAYESKRITKVIVIPAQTSVWLDSPLEISRDKRYLILSCKIGKQFYDLQSQPFPCDEGRCVLTISQGHKRELKSISPVRTSPFEKGDTLDKE